MLPLGLALSLAYIPGITGNVLPTGWALLSLTLPLTLWIKADMTPFHWAGAAFLAYVALSIYWTPEPWDGLWRLWQFCILALAFRLGSTDLDLTPLWRGLAIGAGVSSLIAMAQALGYHPFPTATPFPGIYYNGVASGAIAAMVAVALITERLWLWALLLLPGLLLSGSRGAIAAAVFGIALTFHRRIAYAIIPLIAFAITIHLGNSDLQRFAIWHAAWANLTLYGNGAGSFLSLLMNTPSGLQHPEYVHNDYLQLVFEFGVGTLFLLPLGIFYVQPRHNAFPILATIAVLATVAMPLHIPVTAFILAVASGRMCRDWCLAWAALDNSGPILPIEPQIRSAAIPAQLGLPQ